MVEYLKYTPEISNNWSRAWHETQKQRPWAMNRIINAYTESQMESKLWLITELMSVDISSKNVALLGGWFAHIITTLLMDEVNVDTVTNFEIDQDAKFISYKFNRRYKPNYKAKRKNITISSLNENFDLIINTSCEHMFPMWKFRELNPQLKNSWYVLQSTDDDQYDDHINCVKDEFHLTEQANIVDIKYMGSKKLSNGMNRFMVIGR